MSQPAARGSYVGQRMLRVEDPALLTGRATFLADIDRPGTTDAVFVRSPYAHARVLSIDTTAAAESEGVVGVFAAGELDGPTAIATTIPTRPNAKTVERPLLVSDKARFQGDPVAVVVARDRYLAEDAAALVEIEWEPLPAVTDPLAALEPDAVLVHDELGENNFEHIEFEAGPVERVFESAEHVFRKRFHFGRTHAAPLEGRAILAEWEGNDALTVWSSSQMPFLVRWLLAGLIGIRESRVRVITPNVGGGFGLKVHLFPEEVVVTLASRQLGLPVRWIEDRAEALGTSGHSKEVVMDLEAAVASDGRIRGFRGRFVGDGGAYQGHPWSSLIDPLCAATLLPGTYDLEAVAYEVDAAMTTKCHSTAYRGIGWSSSHTAREALVDDIARALELDPLELRRANFIPDGTPFTTLTSCEYDGGSYTASMDAAADALDYPALRERQARLREQGRYVGVGFSPFVEQGGWAAEIAETMGFPGYHYTDGVSVTMESDGTVTVSSGFQSNGQGHETTMAQLAADALGVAFDDVRVVQGDTAQTAYGTGSWGSRTAVVASGALLLAAADVRTKLLAVAAQLLEASPGDLELREGSVVVRGAPTRSATLAEVATMAYFGPRPEGVDPIPAATRSYDPPETYSNACIAAVVEVDAATGVVDVERLVIVEDCGKVLNPMIVDGQVAGAVAQGVGAVLYEGLPYNEDGTFLAPTLAEFLYPTATALPDMEIHHLETPAPQTAGGFKGMGEGGMIGAPAAVVNAVADALSPLGVSIERTPLRPVDVLELIEAGRADQAAPR